MLACFSVCINAQNDTVFNEGNTLYNQGKYAEAIKKYEALLDKNEHAVALYFNLANAHYKLNNIAPSVYYFEKAKLLSTDDKDIENNLVFAQNMTVDAERKTMRKVSALVARPDWSRPLTKPAPDPAILFWLMVGTNFKVLCFIPIIRGNWQLR